MDDKKLDYEITVVYIKCYHMYIYSNLVSYSMTTVRLTMYSYYIAELIISDHTQVGNILS